MNKYIKNGKKKSRILWVLAILVIIAVCMYIGWYVAGERATMVNQGVRLYPMCNVHISLRGWNG